MKKTIFTFLIFVSFLSTFAFSQSSFTQEEIESLFIQNSQPLELIALSDEEMKTTEGAWVPFAVRAGIGAFYGGAHNIAYQIGKNQGWNWRSFGRAVGRGAIVGSVLTPAGILRVAALSPATMGVRVAHGRIMTKYVQPRWESIKSKYWR